MKCLKMRIAGGAIFPTDFNLIQESAVGREREGEREKKLHLDWSVLSLISSARVPVYPYSSLVTERSGVRHE